MSVLPYILDEPLIETRKALGSSRDHARYDIDTTATVSRIGSSSNANRYISYANTTSCLLRRPSLDKWDWASIEGITVENTIAILDDSFAMPGEVVTIQAIEAILTRMRMSSLIYAWMFEGISWSYNSATKITAETAFSSIRFLENLGATIVLPTISPDGEGSLVMIWKAANPVLVTIENHKIHMVVGAGTPAARYFDDRDFIGSTIPEDILAELPRK